MRCGETGDDGDAVCVHSCETSKTGGGLDQAAVGLAYGSGRYETDGQYPEAASIHDTRARCSDSSDASSSKRGVSYAEKRARNAASKARTTAAPFTGADARPASGVRAPTRSSGQKVPPIATAGPVHRTLAKTVAWRFSHRPSLPHHPLLSLSGAGGAGPDSGLGALSSAGTEECSNDSF